MFVQDNARGVPAAASSKIKRMLFVLSQASELSDMTLFPGWRFHPLKANLRGFWSLTVTGNWRIIFRFENGEAYDVDLVDYH